MRDLEENIQTNVELESSDVEDSVQRSTNIRSKDYCLNKISSKDPYMLGNAEYFKREPRWRNKQRVLILSTRGINFRHRHLMEDLKKLLPHHKAEPKWEKKQPFSEIIEVSELRSCNNIIFLEARRHEELYMWMSKCPDGPCAKFQILNIHTLGELRLPGNNLLGSRPFLSFDSSFDIGQDDDSVNSPPQHLRIPLKLLKEMFIQIFGTPRYHPRSKPFHDHVINFSVLDGKIWFRHYQISPETEYDHNIADKQVLTEIGPRFVLEPILIMDKSFSGQVIYKNPDYKSPTVIRNLLKARMGSVYARRVEMKRRRVEYERNLTDEIEEKLQSGGLNNEFNEKILSKLRQDHISDFDKN
ncbi:ribosome biogenesis protein BRX1 [Cryptosporidium andersoni]|uniref:Ribosome biogenesis protein BRX1 n=1 Tax=Cryptosporidium andersoni TaxID=117008 RepID=A0A1J4MAV6_9CRYT|nr:ribosome biogenesis protein BRX1 [Cryptosporidium andersoni]